MIFHFKIQLTHVLTSPERLIWCEFACCLIFRVLLRGTEPGADGRVVDDDVSHESVALDKSHPLNEDVQPWGVPDRIIVDHAIGNIDTVCVKLRKNNIHLLFNCSWNTRDRCAQTSGEKNKNRKEKRIFFLTWYIQSKESKYWEHSLKVSRVNANVKQKHPQLLMSFELMD